MRGKRSKLVVVWMLILTVLVSQIGVLNAGKEAVKADENSTFTLYYYYEGTENLYANIWYHKGITFTESNELVNWNWDHSLAQFKRVNGYENLYSIEIEILGTESDGITIYEGGNQTTLVQYDNQWNNTTDYGVLVGKTSTEYVIKGNDIFTSLTAAGINKENNNEEDKKEYYPESDPVVGLINVERVKNLPVDFIMGMDISSVLSEFESGVVYKDFEGNTIDNITDFCKFLAKNGITDIRVRVWNNPYDANDKGYGGGNNDVAKATLITDACRTAGIHVLVDFHCSDFWTDPGKQMVPKAWKGYDLDQKKAALADFIKTSLNTIDAAKDTVTMVQVGNETTTGFIGETNTGNMCALFSAGCAAVHEYNEKVKAVIHLTNPEKSMMTKWAATLDSNKVDYDVLATSYYPYWHGTLENLKNQLQTVKNTYKKEVMVAETSYAYTLADSDGHTNTVRVGNNDNGDNTTEPFTVQGQANAIRNLINAVNEAGGIGVFYWEPAWLTVGDVSGLEAGSSEYKNQVNSNKSKWEEFGSGWASSYASEYDPNDAGKWYGGAAVDNEAMFYPDGTPTQGLHVWEYVKTGAESSIVAVEELEEFEDTIEAGENYQLPETIAVRYNKGTVGEVVSWDAEDISAVNVEKTGTYIIKGTVAFSKAIDEGEYAGCATAPVIYILHVIPKNLIEDKAAAGFESGTGFVLPEAGYIQIPANDDPYEGSKSMHWWSASAVNGSVLYDVPISLEKGSYCFSIVAQGAADDKVSVHILDADKKVLSQGDAVALTGWEKWKNVQTDFELESDQIIYLQINVDILDGGWGTADKMYLYKVEKEKPSTPVTPSVNNVPSISEAPSESDTPSASESVKKLETSVTNIDLATENFASAKLVMDDAALTEVILTEEEKTALKNGTKINVWMEVKDATELVTTEQVKQVESAITDKYSVGEYLDIQLWKKVGASNGTTITNLPNGNIKIGISLPKTLRKEGRKYQVVRLHEGTATVLDAVYNPATSELTFETDQFSIYAIVYTDEAVITKSPKTGEAESGMLILMSFALMGIGLSLYQIRKKAYSQN